MRSGVGHADVDGVQFAHDSEVGGRVEKAGAAETRHVLRGHIGNVGSAGNDRVDLAFVQIDAGRVKAASGEFDREWQADVSETDDARAGAA